MTAVATVTYAALCRCLSKERLAGYSLSSDFDSVDAGARYMWNMALCSALTPVLHLAEVAFRNAIYSAGVEATAKRRLRTGVVPCWLDTVPSLLQRAEERDVADAILRLGSKRRHTPGHLVGQLGLGFWVRLCQRPYEQGNPNGPQLWPLALKRFPGIPRASRTRTDVWKAASEIRDFRNLVAHHQPVWDRQPLAAHRRALEFLSWLNPTLAAVAEQASFAVQVYNSGSNAYRPFAASVLTL
ncbi:MAG TPA: hypothetical protein VF092_27105 [Longimicrobium sp.]